MSLCVPRTNGLPKFWKDWETQLSPIHAEGSHLEKEKGIKDIMGPTIEEKKKKAIEEKLGPIAEEELDHSKERVIEASEPQGSVPTKKSPKEQTPLDSNDGPIKQFVVDAEAKN